MVIDFDIGLRNLDLIMGCERRVVYDFVNGINGEATLHPALIKERTAITCMYWLLNKPKDKEALTQDGVEKVLEEL